MQNESFLDAQSEAGRYRLLIQAITDYAIYMLDPTGVVTSWNPGAERFKGYTAKEILGQNFARFYTEEDRAAGVPAIGLETAAREGRWETQGWRVRKDGGRFWANVVIDAIRDPNGVLVGFAKVTRDLTEQRDAEMAMRRSEEQFRLLVQGVSDYAIYMLDPEGRVSSWNLGAERAKGYSASEIIGQSFSMFYTHEDREAGVPARALATAAADGRWETEGWRVRKDGTRFWAHVIIDAIRDDAGGLLGFGKVTRDVTEKRDSQQQLEEAREALFQSQKMEIIGQLTGGVAHDFNNLLTVILGGLDTARRAKDTDPIRADRALDMARQAGERATALTDRLLAFSRRQPLKPARADLNAVARNMTDLLHRTLGEHIELEGVLTPRLWPVDVDPNQLESAILNLAINARDAMADGGKLTIETGNALLDERYAATDSEVKPGQYAMISISDTGQGMPADTLSRVFEPFFTTKEVGKGTGLGLSMVYGFVKQSGGHVTIYSEECQGTTVKLYFPRAVGEAGSHPEALPVHAPIGSAEETILIVEDNEDVRAHSTMIVAELGYRVLEAADYDQAMRILRSDQRVDLLFTDVVLPGKSGRVIADEATQLRPTLKVLYTTGYSRNAIVHHGRLDAGVHLITKPFTFDQLAERIRGVLDLIS